MSGTLGRYATASTRGDSPTASQHGAGTAASALQGPSPQHPGHASHASQATQQHPGAAPPHLNRERGHILTQMSHSQAPAAMAQSPRDAGNESSADAVESARRSGTPTHMPAIWPAQQAQAQAAQQAGTGNVEISAHLPSEPGTLPSSAIFELTFKHFRMPLLDAAAAAARTTVFDRAAPQRGVIESLAPRSVQQRTALDELRTAIARCKSAHHPRLTEHVAVRAAPAPVSACCCHCHLPLSLVRRAYLCAPPAPC